MTGGKGGGGLAPMIAIPAFQPDGALLSLLRGLSREFGEFRAVIVDDGSEGCEDVFSQCERMENIAVLRHEKNKGKGAALKTAFSYIKARGFSGAVITADADGQHAPADIRKVYEAFLQGAGAKKRLVLGARAFESSAPKRSAGGNRAAKLLMRALFGARLCDTQTGLRAFDSGDIDFFLNIKGSGYEYEANMLCEAVRGDFDIREAKIQAVYIEENRSSHFRPLLDGMKITCGMSKYAAVPLSAVALNSIFLASGAAFALANAASLAFFCAANFAGFLFGNRRFLRTKRRRAKFALCTACGVLSSALFGNPAIPGIFAAFSIVLANFALSKERQEPGLKSDPHEAAEG